MNKTFTAHIFALFLILVALRSIYDGQYWITALAILGLIVGMVAMGCKLSERFHHV